jgi:thioredoxin 1
MSNTVERNIIIRAFLIVVVVISLLHFVSSRSCAADASSAIKAVSPRMPALVDVGAKKCIPCKMMAPILDELTTEYAGVLRVEFIDVQIDPERAAQLGVRGIPTQIFYDAKGKERYRHMGYISREDILKTFEKLGIKLTKRNPGKNAK